MKVPWMTSHESVVSPKQQLPFSERSIDLKTRNQGPSSSLDRELLIGKVDLLGGLSVHSVGCRGSRKDVVRLPGKDPGNPLALLQWYRDHGIKKFYLTDLDAHLFQPRQNRLIEKICNKLEPQECLWLDCRVKLNELLLQQGSDLDDLVQRLVHSDSMHPGLTLVLEDLSPKQRTSLSSVGDFIDPQRLAMSILFGSRPDSGAEEDDQANDNDASRQHSHAALAQKWFDQGHQAGIRSGILHGSVPASDADAATENDQQDVPKIMQICKKMSRHYRGWKWACSGIPSNFDSRPIYDSGCSGVLVGTARQSDGQVALV